MMQPCLSSLRFLFGTLQLLPLKYPFCHYLVCGFSPCCFVAFWCIKAGIIQYWLILKNFCTLILNPTSVEVTVLIWKTVLEKDNHSSISAHCPLSGIHCGWRKGLQQFQGSIPSVVDAVDANTIEAKMPWVEKPLLEMRTGWSRSAFQMQVRSSSIHCWWSGLERWTNINRVEW